MNAAVIKFSSLIRKVFKTGNNFLNLFQQHPKRHQDVKRMMSAARPKLA